MTPAGHAAISYISAKIFRKLRPAWAIFGGVLPDIDFIFLPFSFFNSIHRIYTHNLLFAVLASAIVLPFIKNKSKRGVVFLSILIGILLHLAVDSVIDDNPSNGLGIALFFPFSNFMFNPLDINAPGGKFVTWNDPIGRIKNILPELLLELPFILVAVILFIWNKYKNK